MIKGIAFTAYPAKDVATQRAWYERMLGIKFDEPFKEGAVEKYCEANLGGCYFSLMSIEWANREPGSASGVVFEVDDIDRAVKELRAQDVTVEDPYATPVCKVTSFDDPEGNRVSLHQITVPH